MPRITPEDIDAILPQTQCTLCGYDGCMPYAEALVFENAAPSLCEPGGVETLKKISALVSKDPTPHIGEVKAKEKPLVIAEIDENTCIGCVKCIKACPVDAIIGGPKLMHTVITDACTGCELCIPACPVDCIELLPASEEITKANARDEKRAIFRKRHQQFLARKKRREIAKFKRLQSVTESKRKDYVLDALLRVKAKKSAR